MGSSHYDSSAVETDDHASVNSSLTKIIAPIHQEIGEVNRCIGEQIASEVKLIGYVSSHVVGAGGKRLRPAVLLLSARSLGYTESADTLTLLAVVVECIHTATLLHDDVVDHSILRRGLQTANHRWGDQASVLVGDYLYSRAFQIMVTAGSMRAMEILANATNRVALGEVEQLAQKKNWKISESDYLSIIENKTAVLFEAAARIGAVISHGSSVQEEAMALYGKHLGIAYQLIDDLLDYTAPSSDFGKSTGGDLAEGKITLPLLHAYQVGTGAERALLRRACTEGGAGCFSSVCQVIAATDSIEYTIGQAKLERAKALRSLDSLENSAFKQSLMELAAFAVDRNF